MTPPETRAEVERMVRAEIERHVPRFMRGRAALYVPLAVDRILAIVESVTERNVA